MSGDDALLVSGEDERRAVVEVHANRAVRQCIAHTVLVTIVDPGRDEYPLLGHVHVVAWVTEEQALRICIEGRTKRLGRCIEAVNPRHAGRWGGGGGGGGA